jgi:hypothetical protein
LTDRGTVYAKLEITIWLPGAAALGDPGGGVDGVLVIEYCPFGLA